MCRIYVKTHLSEFERKHYFGHMNFLIFDYFCLSVTLFIIWWHVWNCWGLYWGALFWKRTVMASGPHFDSCLMAPRAPLFDTKFVTRWYIFEVGRGLNSLLTKVTPSQKALLPNLPSCSPQLQIGWAQVDIQGSSFKMEGSFSTVFAVVEGRTS